MPKRDLSPLCIWENWNLKCDCHAQKMKINVKTYRFGKYKWIKQNKSFPTKSRRWRVRKITSFPIISFCHLSHFMSDCQSTVAPFAKSDKTLDSE